MLIKLILSSNLREKHLKGPNHVSIEGNSNHFDNNLEENLFVSVSMDVSISNWSKRGNYPVISGDVIAPVFQVQLNDVFSMRLEDPAVCIVEHFMIAYEQPQRCEEVRDKEQNYQKVKYFDEDLKRFFWNDISQILHQEIIKVLLVFLHLYQSEISQENVLLIKHRIRKSSYDIKDECAFKINLGSLKWLFDHDLVFDASFGVELQQYFKNLDGYNEGEQVFVIYEFINKQFRIHIFWRFMVFRTIAVVLFAFAEIVFYRRGVWTWNSQGIVSILQIFRVIKEINIVLIIHKFVVAYDETCHKEIHIKTASRYQMENL